MICLAVHLIHVSDHAVHFLHIALSPMMHCKAHLCFNTRVLRSHRSDFLCLWRNSRDDPSNWQEAIERIMKASKIISDDVTRFERKERKETHEEQFRRAGEAEVALVANWKVLGENSTVHNKP